MECYSYLLFSLTTNRTYIGATNNPDRRLRQHNGEISGGAYATKGKEWIRAVYVGGFPDWQAALQFEWSWKRHSRGKSGLGGKLQGLLNLLRTEKSTTKAIPFSMWEKKAFLVFNEEYQDILGKFDVYRTLKEQYIPKMSFNDFHKLSVQVQELALEQQELLKKVSELTALLLQENNVVEEKPIYKPKVKKPRVKKVKETKEPKEQTQVNL
jgi:predicted GIY-YIG superfamily endonuclease